MPNSESYVYILENISDPSRHYTGVTSDPNERLKKHNSGGCSHCNSVGVDSTRVARSAERGVDSSARGKAASWGRTAALYSEECYT